MYAQNRFKNRVKYMILMILVVSQKYMIECYMIDMIYARNVNYIILKTFKSCIV